MVLKLLFSTILPDKANLNQDGGLYYHVNNYNHSLNAREKKTNTIAYEMPKCITLREKQDNWWNITELYTTTFQ